MDAIILCGGFATRLEPITLFVPKPLLPIKGRPILDHIMEGMEKIEVNRYVFSTNKKFYDQFKNWASCKGNHEGKIELVVEPSMHHGEKFGAIKGIQYTIEKAGLNDDILIVAGDNFYNFGLSKMVEEFKKHRKVTIAVHDIKSVDEASRFGVVHMDGNRVVGFEEKPNSPKSSLISTGIYIIPKEIIGRVNEYVSDGNNPDAPGYFLQWLMGKEEVYGVVYTQDWYDIGTVDTYKKVFDSYLK